jgi:uncharacterized protein (DUF924 family)
MPSPSPEASAVLAFWFDPAHRSHWYKVDRAFDAQIREQFAGVIEQALAGKLDEWATTPSGWLALLIVLDQFSRNIYRKDPRAWAQDSRAQQVALSGIQQRFDQQLPPLQRVFAYMPLEHAEDIELQRRSVMLFEALCNDLPPDQRDNYNEFLQYARRHEVVIACFGRFPHRNVVLGRASTPEEMAYLAEPGSGF